MLMSHVIGFFVGPRIESQYPSPWSDAQSLRFQIQPSSGLCGFPSLCRLSHGYHQYELVPVYSAPRTEAPPWIPTDGKLQPSALLKAVWGEERVR